MTRPARSPSRTSPRSTRACASCCSRSCARCATSGAWPSASAHPGPWVEELEAEGIRHVPLHSSTRANDPLADLRAARELAQVLRREQIDVLHTHNPKPGLYGRVVGRLRRVPVVVNTVHGLYAHRGRPVAEARARLLTRGDRVALLRRGAGAEPRRPRADAPAAPQPAAPSCSATASTSPASTRRASPRRNAARCAPRSAPTTTPW